MGIAGKIGKFLGYAALGTVVLSSAAVVGAAAAEAVEGPTTFSNDVLAHQYDLHAEELENRAREARRHFDYTLAAGYTREAEYARQRARRIRYGVL